MPLRSRTDSSWLGISTRYARFHAPRLFVSATRTCCAVQACVVVWVASCGHWICAAPARVCEVHRDSASEFGLPGHWHPLGGHSVERRDYVEFFFFQAEDGIRDHCVTGVQTCALPIYGSVRGVLPGGPQASSGVAVDWRP